MKQKTGEKCHQLCYLIWKFNEQEKKLNLGPDAELDEYWIGLIPQCWWHARVNP